MQLVHRQRCLEAKMISLRAMTCAIFCLLVGVGMCANFWYQNLSTNKDFWLFLVSEICTVATRGIFSILRWGFQDGAEEKWCFPPPPNTHSSIITSCSPFNMATQSLNLPPVPSATRMNQPTNEDNAIIILQSVLVLKSGSHKPPNKWVTLARLLWETLPNQGPFYHVYRE